MNLFKHRFLLIIIVLLVSAASGRAVLDAVGLQNRPEILQYEMKGLTGGLSLDELCSDNFFSGLEGPMENPSGYRSTSLFYMIPQKLFKDFIDHESFHRNLTVFYYVLAVLALGLLCAALDFHWLAILFVLAYYATSDELVSSVTSLQLTVFSLVWFFLNLILFALLSCYGRLRSGIRQLLAAGLGLCLPVSYEAYVAVRPAAVIMWLCCLVYLSIHKGFRKSLLPFFLVSTVLGGLALKYAHPDIQFDLSLFTAKGESVVKLSGEGFKSQALDFVAERFEESEKLFRWSRYKGFKYYSYLGFLEIWLSIGVLSLYFLFLNRAGLIRGLRYLRRRRWFFYYLFLAFGAAFLTPMLSSQPVRTTRFFMVFPCALMILGALITFAFRKPAGVLKVVLSIVLSAAVLFFFHGRLNRIENWKPPKFDKTYHGMAPDRSEHIRQLITDLEKLEVPEGNAEPFVLNLCNSESICKDVYRCEGWLLWTYALYTSNFYCRIPGEGRVVYERTNTDKCICRDDEENCKTLNVNGERATIRIARD